MVSSSGKIAELIRTLVELEEMAYYRPRQTASMHVQEEMNGVRIAIDLIRKNLRLEEGIADFIKNCGDFDDRPDEWTKRLLKVEK